MLRVDRSLIKLGYFNQSLRTQANFGRRLTFKLSFQTGLETVNGE